MAPRRTSLQKDHAKKKDPKHEILRKSLVLDLCTKRMDLIKKKLHIRQNPAGKML